MVNYGLGKIYKIINDITNDIYVGSTCETLSKRMTKHREKIKYCPERLFYKFVREIGGWEHFKIIMIEDYPCNRKEELFKREQYHKDLLKPTLNKNNAFTSETEKKEYQKNYQNTEEYKKGRKIYYEKNKETRKEYRLKNREKLKKYFSELNQRPERKEYRIQKIQCACGCIISRGCKARHEKTKKHIKLIEIQD